MLNKLLSSLFISLLSFSSFLSAEIEYDILDIGTLQTRESQALVINNKGQILGWYNIEKSDAGKQFFVRNRDGVFYGLPGKEPASGLAINWQYLTDEGKAYGTLEVNASTRALCIWDQKNGMVKLGNLPGKEISAINNAGQVLIKSVAENENGKAVQRPVIWQNGQITKLKGLGGDLGIESEESYGLDMNNKGEVVGKSFVSLSYKNEIYKQMHAVKWINGRAIDLHDKVPKSSYSSAAAINDLGDIFVNNYLILGDGKSIHFGSLCNFNLTDNNYVFDTSSHAHVGVYTKNESKLIDNGTISNKIFYDHDSIWMKLVGITCVNDNGEIIAQGETIYGEKHTMLLVPKQN